MKAHKTINNGKPCWRVIIPTDGSGKRKRRFFKTKDEADQFAADVRASQGDVASRFIAYSIPDQLRLLQAVETAGDATALLEAAQNHAKSKAVRTSLTLAAVIDEFIKSKAAIPIRKNSLASLKSSTGLFAEHVGPIPFADVTAKQIEGWLAQYESSATRRGYLTDLRTLWSFAVKRGYADAVNPARAVERPKLARKQPGIHTIAQVEALLGAALKHDRGLIGYLAPLYFGGLRPKEAEHLQRKKIRNGNIEIDAEVNKNWHRRFIPVNETLAAWLKVRGVQYGPVNLVRRLRRLRKLAGVPWPHDVLRHSFCSYGLVEFGATKTAAWADHSERVLNTNYRNDSITPEKAKAYWALRG